MKWSFLPSIDREESHIRMAAHWGVDHDRQEYIRIRNWPKWISFFLWTRKDKTIVNIEHNNGSAKISNNDGELVLSLEDLPVYVWLKTNCRGEVFAYYKANWTTNHVENQIFTETLRYTMRVEFLNPKDAILFKLRFG